MNCADIEILLCDFLDGTLAARERAEVEAHLAACPLCAELARDASSAVEFMGRAAAVEPPPELITRILFESPWSKSRNAAAAGWRGWMTAVLQPVRQPRFALGMAMTILSCSMLWKYVAPVRQLSPEDLQPARVWASVEDRALRTWARTMKFYENLKFVYQIQSTLREWRQQQDEEQRLAAPEQDASRSDGRKLKIQTPPEDLAPGALAKPPGAGETR